MLEYLNIQDEQHLIIEGIETQVSGPFGLQALHVPFTVTDLLTFLPMHHVKTNPVIQRCIIFYNFCNNV